MDLSRRALLSSPALAAQTPSGAPPNIVFLISDDHTAADLGCYGNAHIRTPHLDRLAAQGVRFTRCFVASPQCSPNRSALFTGCTPHTTATSRLHTPMPPWEPSFLEAIRAKGYFTGALRKVHQGDAFQNRFDYADASRNASFEPFFDKLPAGRPFFLHYGFTDPHRPYRAGAVNPPHDPARVRLPNFLPDTPEVRTDLVHYHDFISRMDAECGRLLDFLDRRGLANNTLIVFTGDNGMPFPGAKGTCYDPGIHVPLLVRWPGVAPAGSVNPALISHVDLPATWLDAAGLPVPGKMQGRSILPVLRSPSAPFRDEIFSERNWHDNFDPIRAVRTARYKLIFNAAPHFPYRPAWDLEASPSWAAIQRLSRSAAVPAHLQRLLNPTRPVLELYDLDADPDEFHNLITDPKHAAARENLLKRLSLWMHQTYDFLPPAFAGEKASSGRGWPATL